MSGSLGIGVGRRERQGYGGEDEGQEGAPLRLLGRRVDATLTSLRYVTHILAQAAQTNRHDRLLLERHPVNTTDRAPIVLPRGILPPSTESGLDQRHQRVLSHPWYRHSRVFSIALQRFERILQRASGSRFPSKQNTSFILSLS